MLGIISTIGGGLFKLMGGGVAKTILGGVSDFFKHKRDLQAAKQNTEMEIEKVKAETVSKQATADIDKNFLWVKQAETSWKDEFWTIIFGSMFVSAFFFPEKLQSGLAVLDGMGDDMKVMMAVVIGSAFGVSLWKKIRKN